MIQRPTTFILGAGAHVPYGFPSGPALTRKICELLPTKFNELSNNEFVQFLSRGITEGGGRPVQFKSVVDFYDSLAFGGHATIDSFLATHSKNHDFSTIGRFALALQLMPLEFNHLFDRREVKGDWMSYLFTQIMLPGAHQSIDDFLEKNRVSFVSFNYDRTLEHCLALRLAKTFGLKQDAVGAALDRIDIAHVYGSFGQYSGAPVRELQPGQIFNGGQSVRLMYEQRRGQNDELAKAKQLIERAEIVVIMGFGFDSDNVQVLELNDALHNDKAVFHTRFGMMDAEWRRAQQPALNRVRFHTPGINKDVDCLDLLRGFALFN